MQGAVLAQTVLSSASLTEHFSLDYLRASEDDGHEQPLCRNIEGWGPLSPFRYDFTPCFLDVWVAAVAVVLGILMGLGAVYYLLRKKSAAPVQKNWHFYAKLGTIGALVVTTALQACLQIEAMGGLWYGDFRFWTSIITLVSLVVIGTVQYREHRRSGQPNGVVLYFWLLVLIA